MKTAAFALLTLLGSSGGVADRYEDQVRKNLQDRYDDWHTKGGGWTRLLNLRDMDVLYRAHAITVTYTLVAGRTYKIVGVCDDDCTNLDLELRDTGGTLIDRDDADNKIPVVDVKVRRTGDFKLKVSMTGCANTGGCEYGVDVYRTR
ncbi:hypothetical protein MF271_05610 [Deinococcus sp. KNUC1210]|uniref:hypothetical protein n=1 Tax=Deinococcus sp. KNUC1210 TaxID=2917691 RepID=UPI001EF126F6|nr:hypothetical protein [Deinococcus sp. KNUC1210]ULH16104.1 hypothetical protein MF271_05610 [Deinococcus sp. KNUC1210]